MNAIVLACLLTIGGYYQGARAQSCDREFVDRCLRTLISVSKKEDFIFAMTKSKFDEDCIPLEDSIGCMHRFARKCLKPNEREQFLNVIRGPEKLVTAMCKEKNDLRDRYFEQVECLETVSKELAYCTEKYIRNFNDIKAGNYEEGLSNQMECCSYVGYKSCLSDFSNSRCGEDAGRVIDEIVELVEGSRLQSQCEEHFDRCSGGSQISAILSTSLLLASLISVACVSGS